MAKVEIAHASMPVLGAAAGLRSITALAVVSWFAQQGKLPVKGTWAAWIAHPATVAAMTLAAAGEYVGDKLPNTPARTAPLGLFGRCLMGGLAGAVVAKALKRPVASGALMAVAGAVFGSFAGYGVRTGLVKGVGLPDLPVALSGDAAAVALAVRSLQRMTG